MNRHKKQAKVRLKMVNQALHILKMVRQVYAPAQGCHNIPIFNSPFQIRLAYFFPVKTGIPGKIKYIVLRGFNLIPRTWIASIFSK
jgi:hypothetical protein